MSKMKVKRSLAGQEFADLYVIGQVRDKVYAGSGRHAVQYVALCQCGEYAYVLASDLKNGNTKSCGCMRRRWLESHREVRREKAKAKAEGKKYFWNDQNRPSDVRHWSPETGWEVIEI